MKIPSQKIYELRAKLQALAERGVNGEKTEAQKALAKLEKRYDFTKKIMQTGDIFAGAFIPASIAAPICRVNDFDIANAIKWAIEERAKIVCLFREGELLAKANAGTAERLGNIATVITLGFSTLWTQYERAGGNIGDRNCFMAGLYDGMMEQSREGLLPSRTTKTVVGKAKRKALAAAPGLALHPYSVALELGKQIRFSVPLPDVSDQLQNRLKGEIEMKKAA